MIIPAEEQYILRTGKRAQLCDCLPVFLSLLLFNQIINISLTKSKEKLFPFPKKAKSTLLFYNKFS